MLYAHGSSTEIMNQKEVIYRPSLQKLLIFGSLLIKLLPKPLLIHRPLI